MPHFQLVLHDGSVETIDGADAYQQEGPMTTFFRCRENSDAIDSWSIRVASIRTADLRIVRRHEPSVPRALAS